MRAIVASRIGWASIKIHSHVPNASVEQRVVVAARRIVGGKG